MALLVLAAAVLAAAALYHFILYPLLWSPVASIPAVHPLAKISSLYMLWIRYWDDENDTVFAAHEKYGQVVQLGPQELSVNCIDDGIKTVYGKNFDRHYFYRVYEDCGRHNLSSSLDATSHAIRKRRVTHIFSKSYLYTSPALSGLLNQIIRYRYLPLVIGYAMEQQPFDTMILFSALAIDVVTGYTFGTKAGTNFLNDRTQHAKCIHEIHKGRPYPMMFWLHEFPGCISFLESIGFLSKERYKSLEALHMFCLDMCDRAENALADPGSDNTAPEEVPTVYQQFKYTLDKEGLSSTPSLKVLEGHRPISCSPQQLEIAAEVCDQIHASDETLAITLTYAVWELSRNVDLQQRLRRECQALGPDIRTDSSASLPAPSLVDSLPLLHAVVMETLRVHPTVAGGQARVTPYGKLSKLGRYENIPGGYRVQSYARFLHANPAVFPDPNVWQPERWLHSGAKTDLYGPDEKLRWFWAFSSGARMCLGSHLALLVTKYVLLFTYSNFETYVVNDEGIEHMKGYVGGPKSGKMMAGVRPIPFFAKQ
ncbi:uncharacterized protein MYCFIDRAFT_188146 [Pseudocercospora fijiensis CIRAD86]|uniref:Cytochrome P450 monooxygenase n=1 Tax=Pseudocercospora fijiensis (strain CIRAD86) TaxID=383855 RepID=M3AEC5_PSEFD|nr:uncharacterized protein MYCFIDRAFT_188146 [Pseudocercospora fijiensis CIRAD86]EME82931.1 hypothetical protein MYCFIDRAFT_188146 [Pseudocercospora fijiensis CIRAD86]